MVESAVGFERVAFRVSKNTYGALGYVRDLGLADANKVSR